MRRVMVAALVIVGLVVVIPQVASPAIPERVPMVRVQFTGSDTYADTQRGPYPQVRMEGEYLYWSFLGTWTVFAYRMEFGLWCPQALEPPEPCPPGTGFNYVTFTPASG